MLFIAVDDLRPMLGAYGDSVAQTPNIDSLATQGMVFERHYVQQALCSPSRSSMLTGRRPDTTRVYGIGTHFRQQLPDVVTLPQHFKNHGYETRAIGKVYHSPTLDDAPSWSQTPPWIPRRRAADNKTWEMYTGPEDDLFDYNVTQRGLAAVEELCTGNTPFFLALGYSLPHLTWVAPPEYYEQYPLNDIRLPPNRFRPEGVPGLALAGDAHSRSFSDVPDKGPIPEDVGQDMIRAYRASVSYVDHQIGRVLRYLDQLSACGDTVVVLWSDHGYQLGEHDLWEKHTNFELSTRSPLIVRTPGVGEGRTRALVESVDLFPTLVELAGLPPSSGLEGTSLVPLLTQPDRPWKRAAFSQYPRKGRMGHALRTDRYRYVKWTLNNQVVATELYDYQSDPQGDINLTCPQDNPVNASPERQQLCAAHAHIAQALDRQLALGWQAALPPGQSADCAETSAHMAGELTTLEANNNHWHRKPLEGQYNEPVVVMHALSFNGPEPAHVRVRDVTPSSFRWSAEEWSYLADRSHTRERASVLVLESGRHKLGSELHWGPDGTRVLGTSLTEARRETVDHRWKKIRFSQNFYATPALLVGVMSMNDETPVVVRVRNLNQFGAELRLQEEEGQDDLHAVELVGWVAVEPTAPLSASDVLEDGLGKVFEAQRTTVSVNHQWFGIASGNVGSIFGDPVANMDSMRGTDPAGIRFRRIVEQSPSGTPYEVLQLKVEEERSSDTERSHANESASYIRSGPDSVTMRACSSPALAMATTSVVDHNWTTINGTFPDVVIAQIGFNGQDTASFRMKGLGPSSVQLRAEEETSGDTETSHVHEQANLIGFFAPQDGNIYDQTQWIIGEVGMVDVTNSATVFSRVNLQNSYMNPMVFTQVMTSNNAGKVHARLRNVSPSGFEVQLEEWNYQNGWHPVETVGYVVVDAGEHVMPNGQRLIVGSVETDDEDWKAVSFFPYAKPPAVVARSQTYYGNSAIVTRVENVSEDSFVVRIQEEEAEDHLHNSEEVAYMALGPE